MWRNRRKYVRDSICEKASVSKKSVYKKGRLPVLWRLFANIANIYKVVLPKERIAMKGADFDLTAIQAAFALKIARRKVYSRGALGTLVL